MTISEIQELSDLIDSRIEILESYFNVTQQLLTDDIEQLDSLLNVRQVILEDYIKLNTDIEAFVCDKEEIRELLKYNGTDELNGELAVFKDRLQKAKNLTDTIKSKDIEIGERFEGYKQELVNDMLKMNQNKRVINYVDSISKTELFNGKKFDEKN